MGRVRITGLDKDILNLKRRVLRAVEESKFDNILAREVRAKIRNDGINPDLAKSTIEYRKKIVSRKGPGFQAGRSSLTLSGQLLGAMTSIFQRARSAFYFGVKNGIHRPYKYQKKNGKTSNHGGNSALIDIWNGLMKDRPVTNVFNDSEFKRRIERRLVSAIKRFIK